jgi:hypothetical protein
VGNHGEGRTEHRVNPGESLARRNGLITGHGQGGGPGNFELLELFLGKETEAHLGISSDLGNCGGHINTCEVLKLVDGLHAGIKLMKT